MRYNIETYKVRQISKLDGGKFKNAVTTMAKPSCKTARGKKIELKARFMRGRKARFVGTKARKKYTLNHI